MTPPRKTILFPTDFSESTREVFPIARALARDSDARIIILHIVEPTLFAEDATGAHGSSIPNFLPTDSPAHRDLLQARLREFYPPDPSLAVEYVVRDGTAARRVLAEAGEVHADLIVMGTHGRTGLGRLVMGSVAEAVMHGATCPVVAVKTPIPDEPLAEPTP